MAISKRVRFEVFKRDRFTCQYCGRRPPDVMLEVDHVVPRVEGGGDEIENLTTSCVPCNRGKAGIPLGSVAPALEELELMAAMQEMLERKLGLDQQIRLARAREKSEAEALDLCLEWWLQAFGWT